MYAVTEVVRSFLQIFRPNVFFYLHLSTNSKLKHVQYMIGYS